MPTPARSGLHHLQPSLLNRYERHYFQSADGHFRLTVDSGLQFAAARQAQGTRVTFRPPTVPVVIEVKYGLAEAEYAAHVTSTLPFRLPGNIQPGQYSLVTTVRTSQSAISGRANFTVL